MKKRIILMLGTLILMLFISSPVFALSLTQTGPITNFVVNDNVCKVGFSDDGYVCIYYGGPKVVYRTTIYGTTPQFVYNQPILNNTWMKSDYLAEVGGEYQVAFNEGSGGSVGAHIGYSVSTPYAIPVPAPTQVTGLVKSVSGNDLTLSWNTSDAALSYNIYKDGVLVGNVASTSYTVQGLSVGTYNYTVSGVNGGGEGPESTIVQVVILDVPSQVTGVQSTVTGKDVTIIWNSGLTAENITDYNIYLNGSSYAIAANSPYVLTDLPTGNYTVRVAARNVVGEGSLSVASDFAVESLFLSPPANITAVPSGSGEGLDIALSWDHVVENTGYVVYVNDVVYDTLGVDAVSLSMSNVGYGHFSIQIATIGVDGEGDKSLPVLVDNPAPLIPPSLGYNSLTDTSLTLVWPMLEDVLNYKVYDGSVNLIATVDGATNWKGISGLTKETQYTFYVSAVYADGESDKDFVTVRTKAGVPEPVFGNDILNFGISVGDIVGGLAFFIGKMWPLLALSLSVPLAFYILPRVISLARRGMR